MANYQWIESSEDPYDPEEIPLAHETVITRLPRQTVIDGHVCDTAAIEFTVSYRNDIADPSRNGDIVTPIYEED